MRISDWSSDVCSSDLDDDRATAVAHHDGTTVGGGEPARAQRLAGDEAARLVGPPARIDNPDAAVDPEHWIETLEADLPRLIAGAFGRYRALVRSEEHTSELQSLMRISYAVFCLKKKKNN